MLFEVYSAKGYQLWNSMHLPRSEGQSGRGQGRRVSALWMSRMWRLAATWMESLASQLQVINGVFDTYGDAPVLQVADNDG